MKMKKFLLTMLLAVVGGASAWAQTNATSITSGGYYRIYGSGSQGKSYLISNESSLAGSGSNNPYSGTDNKDVWIITSGGTEGTYTVKNVNTETYINITAGNNTGGSSSLSESAQDLVFTNNTSFWYIGAQSELSHRYLNFNKAVVNVWSADANDNILLYPMTTYAVTVTGGSATVAVSANNHVSAITGTSGTVYVDAAATTLTASNVKVISITAGYQLSSVTIDNENKTISVSLEAKTIAAGYYRLYSVRNTNQGLAYIYSNNNSKSPAPISTSSGAYYQLSDNMDVWQLAAGTGDGTFTLKNVGSNNYLRITSGASSGSSALGEAQDLTLAYVSGTNSFGNLEGWTISDGSENAYRYLNCNASKMQAGIYSADGGDVFALLPLEQYDVTVTGETSATVTVRVNNHLSSFSGASGTVYVDATVLTPRCISASDGYYISACTIDNANKTIAITVAEGYSVIASKDMQLRTGNKNQSATGAAIEVRQNTSSKDKEYGFCGVIEFDLTALKGKLDAGYTITGASLQLTDASNNQTGTLVAKPFPSGWAENGSSTTYEAYSDNITSAISADALCSIAMQRTTGQKGFELQNASSQQYPFPISSCQATSTDNTNLATYLTNQLVNSTTAVSVLIGRDATENTQGSGFYTKDVLTGLSGTPQCPRYEWNSGMNRWWQVDASNTITRIAAVKQFFCLADDQFTAEAAPRLIVTIDPPTAATAAVVVTEGLKTSITLSADNETAGNIVRSNNGDSFSFSTVKLKDNATMPCLITNQERLLYIGKYNVDDIKAVRFAGNLEPAGNQANFIGMAFYGPSETAVDGSYINSNSTTIRNGSNDLFRIYGRSTIDGITLYSGNPGYFKRGPYYTADFTNRKVTVDAAGFKTYWDNNTAAVTMTQTYINNNTSITNTTGFTKTATGEKDLYIWIRANSGRAAIADLTIYMTDGSEVTVPVTQLTAGSTTTEFSENYTAAQIAGAYLNTTGEAVSAATLGDVTLTTDNISAFNALKSANIDVTASSASYDLTVNSCKASTLMLPFNAALPDGVSAWTLNYTSGDKVTATTASSITANTPVLINANAGNYTFTATDATIDPVSQASGALTGVYTTTNLNYDGDNSYILWANNENPIGFYKANSSTVAPYRAYLTAEGAGTKLMIDFDGMATGLESLTPNPSPVGEGSIFNLAGQRMSRMQKGINIENGKKVLVK